MSQKKSVQLVGKELEQARRDTKEAVEKLGRIAALTLEKIGHKPTPLGPRGIARITVRPNNTTMYFYTYDPQGGYTESVGEYDDSTGVCREATHDDSSGSGGEGGE
ncbi:MAG: hypothetical protein WAL71_21060 [Terriglobales bacterium]